MEFSTLHIMGLVIVAIAVVWFIGPKIVGRLSRAHYKAREEHTRKILDIAKGE